MSGKGAADAALGAAAIAACWGAGELVVRGAGLPIPGSLVGMALLAAGVRRGWLPAHRVRAPAAWLIRWMPLFFVPAGVALMAERSLAAAWLPVAAGAAASTIAVLAVVGRIHQRLAGRG